MSSGDLDRLLLRRLRQDDAELLAAVAREHLFLAYARLDAPAISRSTKVAG